MARIYHAVKGMMLKRMMSVICSRVYPLEQPQLTGCHALTVESDLRTTIALVYFILFYCLRMQHSGCVPKCGTCHPCLGL